MRCGCVGVVVEGVRCVCVCGVVVVEGVRCVWGWCGCVGGLTNEVKKGRQNALRQSLRSLVWISSA